MGYDFINKGDMASSMSRMTGIGFESALTKVSSFYGKVEWYNKSGH